jgi:hypothetical protein
MPLHLSRLACILATAALWLGCDAGSVSSLPLQFTNPRNGTTFRIGFLTSTHTPAGARLPSMMVAQMLADLINSSHNDTVAAEWQLSSEERSLLQNDSVEIVPLNNFFRNDLTFTKMIDASGYCSSSSSSSSSSSNANVPLVDLIVGVPFSSMASSALQIATPMSIPLLAAGAASSDFSNKLLYPTFSRVYTPSSKEASILANIVAAKGWSRVRYARARRRRSPRTRGARRSSRCTAASRPRTASRSTTRTRRLRYFARWWRPRPF